MDLPPFDTHAVTNQPPEFASRDLWADDLALREAVHREGAGAFAAHVATYGVLAGDELYALSFDAHRDRPRLRTHDRFGQRIDRVEFHPAYHRLMEAAIAHGVAGLSWTANAPGAHVARAALSYLHHQVEPGTSCPLTMTHAAVPVLRREPALAEWLIKAVAPQYDPRDVPLADKPGITLGMGMTEKQGGSDVRANSTRAEPLSGDGEYRLVGHKWFMSAPMSDGFLVLAQAPGGLTCLLLPRLLPEGRHNAYRVMRLKDKLGDWSNASSEVEFCGAWARRIGEEGRGVATILEMVMLTRLDCMLGSAAEMRMALAQALHHVRHRRAFGRLLLDQPLMRNVLADLALDVEAAVALALHVAGALERADRDPLAAALARIGTAVGKYWVCKRAPALVNEAQECLGGAGYVEESLMPRLYRQAPLNSIWEGSGNIQCLDVLRALEREPEHGRALWAWIESRGVLDGPEGAIRAASLRAILLEGKPLSPVHARLIVEQLALAMQYAVLRGAGSPLAEAFRESRMAPGRGLMYGSLSDARHVEQILARVAGSPGTPGYSRGSESTV